MTNIDLAPLKPAIEKYILLGRSGLLPALHAAQKIYGWVSEPVAAEIAKLLRVPLADVHGVIEFYSLFYNEPTSKHVIRVCTDVACALKDADGVLNHLCAHHGLKPGQTTDNLSLTLEPSPCLGLCEHAPAVWTVDNGRWTVGNGSSESDRPQSMVYGPIRLLTANCGNGTTSLEKYGEYSALKKAKAMKPEEVVAEVKASGLVGRGGAAFPTGVKWEGAAKAEADQKYVICNADESEPGTFKDRVLLIDDPHRTIEGMCIAAYAIGATKGYIYIRGEYPYIVPVLENALNEARVAGYLNENFDIEIRVGAGAYICGEETALFESIEGKRGFPRIKPPFPTTHGLFGRPTVINNVESLCNISLIISMGSAEYRKIGTEKSPGPKLFCVSGDVAKPGVYEAPFGVTLRELLEMAGLSTDSKTDSRTKTDLEADSKTDSRMKTDLEADSKTDSRTKTDLEADSKADSRTKTDLEADSKADSRTKTDLEADSKADSRMKTDKGLQAVLFGGAAGAFATSAHLDVKLTFEDLRAAGLPLGSGVVMVFDETRDMRQALKSLGHFFAHESCGKCYPCQMGTQRQKEILDRISEGKTLKDDLIRLQDVGWTMTDASLCGLGQTAASAVLSAMKLWPGLFKDEGRRMKDEMGKKKEVRGKKATAKKTPAKKSTAKKGAVKISPVVKKTVAKKITTKKPTVKKPAKKPTTKKTSSKAVKSKPKRTAIRKATKKL